MFKRVVGGLDPGGLNRSLPVDLIRTVAIVLVILLHAAIEPAKLFENMSSADIPVWWTVDFYSSVARPAVPLFIMLSGALLLQPAKTTEPLKLFFKKRLNRIALPFIFWGVIYFLWRFLVNQEPFSYEKILTGVLIGPYNHFWFLYMLVGLYLITPILRVVVANAEWKTVKYFFAIWLIGTAVIPLIGLTGPFRLHEGVFVITGWVGYFFFGAYLQRIHIRPLVLYSILFLGTLGTIVGTFLVTEALGALQGQAINDPCGICAIAASIALFLILITCSPDHFKDQNSFSNKLMRQISQNTLGIFLVHVIILETLQKGYLGFKISILTIDPIIEVPMVTLITLFASLALVVALKKIPYIARIIG